MLYEKKRRKLNLPDQTNKNYQDSTKNSEHHNSTEKNQIRLNNKKSFTKLFIKRTHDPQSLSKRSNQSKKSQKLISKNDQNHQHHSPSQTDNLGQPKLPNQQNNVRKDLQKQKFNLNSNTASTCSLQPHNQQGLNKDRKKFKLYCQVKKKKQNQKKSQYQKQGQKFTSTSTVSQSWMKNSIFSRNSQKHNSSSTKKSNDKTSKSSKRKIDLTEKINQIKNKQKQKSSIQKNQLGTPILKSENDIITPTKTDKTDKIELNKDYDTLSKNSEYTSKKNKKSLQKKHSTLNIKRSVIIEKLLSQKQKQSKIQLSLGSSLQSQKGTKIVQLYTQPKKSSYKPIQNKILPQDSQIIQQEVKKLSQIKQQKNQDTISRSFKALQINSIDHSISKNHQQGSGHLSIDSICKDHRKSLGCILQTTQLRESKLKNMIQSSLSSLQKTRQKIDIKKFQGLKNIAQLGSQISQFQQNMTTIEKIQFHIQIINTLSNFVYKSTELEYLMQDWDQLNFLIYKKFYIERVKVLNFLKKYPIKNPFVINRASLQTKQVLKALRQNDKDIKRIKSTLQSQNATIKKNLETFYNQFSKQQHGQKINLLEYDNFSHWIYKQIWDEIQLLSYSQSHNKEQIQDRICKSLQSGFLISQLNGNYVLPFQYGEIASRNNQQKNYIQDHLQQFQRYVLNKKK